MEGDFQWTKKLDKLPKFSITYITKYIEKGGKERAFDKGYNFFIEDYVHDAFITMRTDKVHVKAKCWRSQSRNEAPHQLWVQLNLKDGNILCGECSCVAGSGGVCNHIVALLYVINHWSATKEKEIPAEKACTSLPMGWHIPRGDKISPEPLMKVSFAKATTDRKARKRAPVFCKLYDARPKRVRVIPSVQKLQDVAKTLKSRSSNIPFAYLLQEQTNKMKDTLFGDVCEGSPLDYQLQDYHKLVYDFQSYLPNPVLVPDIETPAYPHLPTRNGEPYVPVSKETFSNDICTFIEELTVEINKCHEIEAFTVDQGKNPIWHSNRAKRVTASKFGDILNRKSTPSEAFVKNPFQAQDLSKVRSVAHGMDKEALARKLYAKKMKKAGHNITVYHSGLVLNPAFPYLGASPDGKVIDKNSKDMFGLLEIKCPYKYRNYIPSEAVGNADYCLERVGDGPRLKVNHNYYYQIQGQMAIAGLSWCDFVVYTNKGIFVERVTFDKELWCKEMFPKLAEFYLNYGIKYLLKK